VSKNTSLVLGFMGSVSSAAIIYQRLSWWETILAFIFLLLLLLIGWIDWHTGYILDPLTIGGSCIFVGFQLSFYTSSFLFQLFTSILIFLCLYVLAKGTKRLGEGDAKLVAMCALLMDWQSVLLALWIASISGLIFISIRALQKKITIRDALPFGPHIALGAFSSYLYGEQVLNLFL
jgi:prepilin signal peptidase PulO-like enzyme (type II secretory pathway)